MGRLLYGNIKTMTFLNFNNCKMTVKTGSEMLRGVTILVLLAISLLVVTKIKNSKSGKKKVQIRTGKNRKFYLTCLFGNAVLAQ